MELETVFHKLGGGIAAIKNIADLINGENLNTPEKREKALGVITNTCDDLLSLIKDYRYLSTNDGEVNN